MSCADVEDLLSAYLDNALTAEEHNAVAAHLQGCTTCSSVLADYEHIDYLLRHLPRVAPDPALRDRIFTDPEYLELTGTTDTFDKKGTIKMPIVPTFPQQRSAKERTQRTGRPQLVSLPGGRSSTSKDAPTIPHPATLPLRHQLAWGQRAMQTAVVATMLLTLGVAGFISWHLWLQHSHIAQGAGGITPPTSLQNGPLPAGMRFVFARDGALWSGATDGSAQVVRLTPTGVTVAMGWAVRPPLAGHTAGDAIAYIDLQHGFVHTIRSDGQSDTIIQQPLLKAGVQPTSVWDTETGQTILRSLTWSKDGNTLAFIADQNGTGAATLFLYTPNSGQAHQIALPVKGAVAHPVWSPDSIRVGATFTHDGNTGIIDYNTENHGILTIADAVNTSQYPTDTVQTLAWSPNLEMPALTWSVGAAGHIHTIWTRRIATPSAQLLGVGNYLQATYSQTGHDSIGSWLLVAATGNSAGNAGDMQRLDLNENTALLTHTKQVHDAQWSPDGTYIDYFDALSTARVGILHQINVSAGIDRTVATGVAADPAPAWSADSQHLLYSTGVHTFFANVHTIQPAQQLKLQGPASAFTWFTTPSQQLVISIGDGQDGTYLVNTQNHTTTQIDKEDFQGPISWTEIP